MSIAGSYAESVYFEEAYQVPGPCKTCCLRCPLPSLIATVYFVTAVIGFCASTIIAFLLTEDLFPDDNYYAGRISTWRFGIMIGLIIWGSLNLILCVIMISCSCLGTGATRKEFVCRFRSRAKGRCQTWVMMLFVFLVLLIWIGLAVMVTFFLEFFFLQAVGQCRSCTYSGQGEIIQCDGEIDIRQWGLAPWYITEESKVLLRGESLEALCGSPVLWWFVTALVLNFFVILTLIHFLVNFSANFAKLRDRFKAGYIDRRTGTYLTRSDNLRSSRMSVNSRASVRGRQARNANKRNGSLARNGNGTSTISTIQTGSGKDDGLAGSRDDISLSNLNPYYRSGDGNIDEDEPPSYSAQNYNAYEAFLKNQDDVDYGDNRSYRRGDEPIATEDQYYGNDRGRGNTGMSTYKVDLEEFNDGPEDDHRNTAGTYGATYHEGETTQQQRDSYHSDPSSLQSQVSHFRARQEYFI